MRDFDRGYGPRAPLKVTDGYRDHIGYFTLAELPRYVGLAPNKGINVLAEVIRKYWPLFPPGNVLASATPIVNLTWIRMFATAWYSEDFVPVDSGFAADVL